MLHFQFETGDIHKSKQFWLQSSDLYMSMVQQQEIIHRPKITQWNVVH